MRTSMLLAVFGLLDQRAAELDEVEPDIRLLDDEDHYIERLRATGSPLYDLIIQADQDSGKQVANQAKSYKKK